MRRTMVSQVPSLCTPPCEGKSWVRGGRWGCSRHMGVFLVSEAGQGFAAFRGSSGQRGAGGGSLQSHQQELTHPRLRRGARGARAGRAPLCSFPLAAGRVLGQGRLGFAWWGSSPMS